MEAPIVPQMKDELGEKVQKLFQDFLEEYFYLKIFLNLNRNKKLEVKF